MVRRWLTNTHNPTLPDAKMDLVLGPHDHPDIAWERHLKWLEGKIIGKPKGNEHYTVEEMEKKHLVGVYIEE